jgi:hypothetical protein
VASDQDTEQLLQQIARGETAVGEVWGAVITVNSAFDGDARDSELTLREAILVSNRSLEVASLTAEEQLLVSGTPSGTDRDLIQFQIPAEGPYSIQPTTTLPFITDPVVLDATTQPGFSGTPLVDLDGNLAGGADGLTIASSQRMPSFFLAICDGRVAFTPNDNHALHRGTTEIPTRLWTHIAVTREFEGRQRAYINGDLEFGLFTRICG